VSVLLLLLLLLLFLKIPWAPVSHSRSFNPPHLADCHDSITLFRIADPFNVALPSTHALLAFGCSHWADTKRKKKKEQRPSVQGNLQLTRHFAAPLLYLKLQSPLWLAAQRSTINTNPQRPGFFKCQHEGVRGPCGTNEFVPEIETRGTGSPSTPSRFISAGKKFAG
jgi:hypothetical protein